jgi:hypothetical protein
MSIEIGQIISEVVFCLLHELSVPLTTVHMGCHHILKDVDRARILQPVKATDEICEQFISEIHALREHLHEEVDLESPAEAAAHLRRLAAGWRKHEAGLSSTVRKMDAMKKAGLEVEEEVEAFLKTLFFGWRRVDSWLSYWEALEANDLSRWDDARLAQVVGSWL